ncbi:hypothetical protein PLICRDRAFT_542724 [Plicaturopsis crispa FD-325 SS-3]|nr:hypothetical protein PLICRDRAFT_542724 [Plicaturopsis crispa FD-325 SS-3]
MLSQKPEDPMSTDSAPPVSAASDAPAQSQQDSAVQALLEVMQASVSSPEFHSMGSDMNEFLTSPYDDSPFDEMLTTPLMDSLGLDGPDIMTSPIMEGYGTGFEGRSLFSDTPDFDFAPFPHSKPPAHQLPKPPVNPDFDAMYTMPSPNSPSLDPNSLYASPRVPYQKPLPSNRRKSSATGTRKNLTPASLVPIDAPTQPRKYTGPSATARKELPAVFARKRPRSQAFPDEEDELEEMTLPPNPTEQQLIEAKRRQNTIAARRSRKRKLEYQRELEDTADELRKEVEMWKSRAVTSEALLKSHGIDVPQYPPS